MASRSAVLLLCMAFASMPALATDALLFEDDVLPVMVAKCAKCHSTKVRKGDLDLTSMSGVSRGGESGDELVSESLDHSHLWTVIDQGEMPPDGEPPLAEAEIDLFRRWIEAGAPAREVGDVSETRFAEHDVLPIVLLRCTTCHGPQRQQGGLDLRTRHSMLRGGNSGPALIPGDAKGSLMVQRIETDACPPRDLLLKFFVRRPPQTEVDILRKWIDAGAPAGDVVPDVATTAPDPYVTDEDRQHWAFQPPRDSGAHASIDGFILERLAQQGMTFSASADRSTLIRRAFIDLIGIPPSLEQWRHWVHSSDPFWYEQMIDELLASPQYGERWGRYWLDLAGYADSEGGVSADPIRPLAWKYRDYVIQAFNADKPYDRFLLEQLAGDELVDYENADAITEDMVEHLVATGFLRMGIDETGSRTMNFVPERLKVISDVITVVSSGLMGMTMECARCHTHKYDPIPHRDYYRMKSIFQGALDEHDWSSFKTRTLDVATTEHRQMASKVNPPFQAQIKRLTALKKKRIEEVQIDLLRHHYPGQSSSDNSATLVALRKADNNRTLRQKMLVERLQKAEILPDFEQSDAVLIGRREIQDLQKRMDSIRRRMVPETKIRALWDSGRPSPTYVLRRGEHDKPGMLVGPGVPSVLTDGRTPFNVLPPFPDGTPKTGRRLAFAKWLTRANHPLTARVMVNRIWYHHFGAGLVKDLENFGVKTQPPSHPELLDWLAIEFVQRGWSIKAMHRLMMTSRVYRQSSRVTPKQLQLDPANRFYSRMPMRRMDAEALRDSLLFVAGRLDPQQGGLPDTVSIDRDGLVHADPTDRGGWRRSVYLQYRRTEIVSMMDTFDYPQMGPHCISRSVSTASPQSLMLMNNGHVRELASAMASRIAQRGSESDAVDGYVERVHQTAIGRSPSSEERRLGVAAIKTMAASWDGDLQRALETYCHTILNSAAFLYVD